MAPPSYTPALLLLEDGALFHGRALTSGTRFAEVVFNTSMTGYQEILTDPSYRGQIVVMTQPHIGNYGIRAEVAESGRVWVEGFVARRFTRRPSGVAPEQGLIPYLRGQGVPALEGIDTRALVRHLREHGALRGVITSDRLDDLPALSEELAAFPLMAGRALVDEVTCEAPYTAAAQGERRARLALYDFGAKSNIVRSLTERGAEVTVLPARTPAAECRRLGVDGVVLSNGPGDPEPLTEVISIVRQIVDSGLPLFGICLGHQLLGLAMGGRTFKLKFGHHGGNQPVQDLDSGRVAITSQNHGFAVDPESLPEGCRPTHRNLNDGTLEGFELVGKPVFAAQYHPEAAPGPHDSSPLFDRFLEAVAGAR